MIQKHAIKTIAPIAAAMFFLTSSANAETWIRCDSCSLSQSEALAVAVGPEQEVIVFSARDHTAQAYSTVGVVTGPGCQQLRPGTPNGEKQAIPKKSVTNLASNCVLTTVAQSVALGATKQQLVDLFYGAYVETNGTMQKTAQVNIANIPNAPSGPGPVANDPRGITAYDVRNNVLTQVALRNAATAYVLSASGQLNHLMATIASMVGVTFAGTEHQLNLVITLADGSKVQFDFTTHSDNAQLFETTDPNGTPIMEVGSPAALYLGTHQYQTNQDANNFLRNAALNEIPISNPGIGGHAVTCSSTIVGGETIVSCKLN